MTGIHRWLLEMGLEQYTETFQRNDIGTEVLADLTDQDLEKLGVTVGHRKKLLKAIHALNADDANGTAVANQPPSASINKPISSEAERRQLTVMFCDLVGSTALSQALDPEQLRDLMRSYQQTCGAIIEKYDGHVAQYLGDGLMIYFGWPRAHEEDAERAVRAGLEIIEAVKKIQAVRPLQVRIGIGTGRVVVGETGRGDASVPKLAVGETPNLAARVQGLAAAGEILLADTTHRLAGGVFEYEDLGWQTLKGIIEPERVWRVVRLAQTAGRFDAARGIQLTHFVGREEEIGLIMRRWALACDGEGQVVTVCGEPGIGKSRILRELQLRLARIEHIVQRFQCSPYHTNSPLHPFVEQIEREAMFDRDDTAEARHDKLKALILARDKDPNVLVPLFAPVVSVEMAGRYPALNLSPQKQREETLASLCEWVAGAGAGLPVLVIFEDVHWIDPTSQQTLDLIVPAIARRRVLLLVMHRPEYVPPWTGFGHTLPLTLTRLARRQAAELVARVTKGIALPEEVLGQIVAKTDGVPLFVEELTKTVIESGYVERTNGAYKLTGKLGDFAIPSTLHDSLMARLDRFAPMREAAQISACIGREFSRSLLASVSPMNESDLNDAIQQLISGELIYAVGAPFNARYMFKHALVQDAAYESLLRRRPCELHLAIAETLSKTPGTEPALLASHYTKADAPEHAVPKWLEAAQKALASAQHVESIAHIRNGLGLLSEFKSEQDRVHFEVSLHTILALNYVATRSYGAPEVQESYSRAEELLPRVKDDAIALPVMLGIGIFHWLRADFVLSLHYFEDLLRRAQRAGDPLMTFAARSEIATIKLPMGKPAEGRELVRKVLEDYDPSTHGVLASIGGQDYAVLAAGLGAIGEAHLGFFDQARKTAERGIRIAENLKHPFSIGMALACATMTELDRGDFFAAAGLARRCIEVCDEQGLPYWANYARVAIGLVKARDGDHEAGTAMIEQAIAGMEQLGSVQSTPWLRIYWAEAMLLGRRAEAIHETMLENLAVIGRTEQAWHAPMTHFMIGRSWLERDDAENAELAFRATIDHARAQDSKTAELRATTWIARLWRSQGRQTDAYDLLAPVYDWFTEGFDTANLTDAKKLLETLSQESGER